MIDVITVLKNQERFAADLAQAEGRPVPKQADWLASHPSNDQRLQTITQLASQYKGNNYGDEGRARYLKVLSGIQFGDSAAQGLTRGRNFYHAPLDIALTAPVGWKIQNTAEQLAMVNAAGDVALMVRVVPPKAGANHAAIIRSVLQPTDGRTEATSINGLQATRFAGVRQNAQGQPQNIDATLVTGPSERTYLLLSNAKDAAALQRSKAQLREAEGSFRAMTAQDRSAARAWVIRTVPYPRGGFTELAKSSPIARPEQQLRLINGVYAGGEPNPGQLVKVIDLQ
jgi:predicted Zn-dependent protease